jgi:hypothetical protein
MSRTRKRVNRRVNRRRKTNKRVKSSKTHTKRHLYRKRRQLIIVPGSQGLGLFTTPVNKQNQMISVNNGVGNMIPGLRNM